MVTYFTHKETVSDLTETIVLKNTINERLKSIWKLYRDAFVHSSETITLEEIDIAIENCGTHHYTATQPCYTYCIDEQVLNEYLKLYKETKDESYLFLVSELLSVKLSKLTIALETDLKRAVGRIRFLYSTITKGCSNFKFNFIRRIIRCHVRTFDDEENSIVKSYFDFKNQKSFFYLLLIPYQNEIQEKRTKGLY